MNNSIVQWLIQFHTSGMKYAVGTSIDLSHLNEHQATFADTVQQNIRTEYEVGETVRFIWLANPA